MNTLVLGIGNLLLCDEGVGVHAVRALQREDLPPDITVLEVGTAVLDALPEIERADHIIIIDAMKADHAPGTVYRVPMGDCVTPEYTASLHGFDLPRVMFLAGRTAQADVIVIGVEPARIEWGTELSKVIRDTIPAVIRAVRTEIESCNYHSVEESEKAI
jgi:hydrogenase maturation protease